MKVRECHEGTECTYDKVEGGVIIQCPVCSNVWMDQDQYVGPCQHIRFFYSTFTHDFLFYPDDWDHASFEESFWKLYKQDEEQDEQQAFRDLNHPDVDVVVYYVQDEAMGRWALYWGYKTEKESL